jgi:hypothetical protein
MDRRNSSEPFFGPLEDVIVFLLCALTVGSLAWGALAGYWWLITEQPVARSLFGLMPF